MRRRLYHLILMSCSLFIWLSARTQTDSSHLRASLITCGPADELYSIWGHTAIRVTDSSTGMDAVFNYGTFDNSDPYFYVKFTRGIMRYALSVEGYRDFLEEYKQDRRSVIEQQLMLTGEQKRRLFELLKINASEENRYYNYHFCEDNCTTRAKDIVCACTNDSILFHNILAGRVPTYRELFHENLNKYRQYWSRFGIDFLLGSNMDKHVTNEQAMFLPDYLKKGFDSATLGQHPLVGETRIILNGSGAIDGTALVTPLNVYLALAIFMILLSFSSSRTAEKVLKIADTFFFSALGLLGLVIMFVWLGRVDDVCRNNLNILWAWPTHVVVIFLSRRRYAWIRVYFRIAALIALLLLLAWPWLPQQLDPAFAPLLIIIVLRGFLRGRAQGINGKGRKQQNYA